MKVSKIEGLKMLQILEFPTVKSIDPNLLDENSQILKQGLSVRTSPKKNRENNVYLPSIHNCTDLNELREFINQYQSQYHMIVHPTVKPEQIGSISRYQAGEDKVVIEIFKDFETRKKGIIENRATVPVMGNRFAISQLEMQEKKEDEFKIFGKVIKEVSDMPFETYDAEFVVQNGQVLFTDLTIQGRKDAEYAEELTKQKELNKEEQRWR